MRRSCCAAGTGKTSFIKALACHTGRSIINIPLSRIKTNQQLMDMMFDQRVQVGKRKCCCCCCCR
jgi:midasin (ATPase involved in ribosome maturation)